MTAGLYWEEPLRVSEIFSMPVPTRPARTIAIVARRALLLAGLPFGPPF